MIVIYCNTFNSSGKKCSNSFLVSKLSSISLHEGILILEKLELELPISEFMDKYTSKVRDSINSDTWFKKGVNKRKESPEIKFDWNLIDFRDLIGVIYELKYVFILVY